MFRPPSVFCSKAWLVLYLDFSDELYCYGQTRLAAGVTGKSRRVGAKGQSSRGLKLTHQERTKGREEESDMGGRGVKH